MLISAGQQRGVSGGLLLLSKVQERGQLAQPCPPKKNTTTSTTTKNGKVYKSLKRPVVIKEMGNFWYRWIVHT